MSKVKVTGGGGILWRPPAYSLLLLPGLEMFHMHRRCANRHYLYYFYLD